MTKILLAMADRHRGVMKSPDVLMRNRYIEPNPVLSDDMAFIQRPALKRWLDFELDFPPRSLFQQPGTFDDDMWVVVGENLYRVDRFGNKTLVADDIYGSELGATVSMCCTGDVGTIPPFMFLADGQTLRVYIEDGYAQGILTATAVADNDVVSIAGVYYKFTSGSVDAGTPAGTVGNPWLVNLEVTPVQNYDNLLKAINDSGINGTDYSTAVVENGFAVATRSTSTGLYVRAADYGAAGNIIVLTETGADMSWDSGTMTGGGTPSFTVVPMPADYAVISVGFIASHVIVVPMQGQGINGRFYWIEPGYTIVDQLNYATAERSPDPIYQVVIFGDQFWLPGQSTTETWFMTGDPNAPVSRVQGILFDRGTYPGTAVQVKGAMVIVDADGGVFKVQGGEARISTPDIEERIRKALAYQNARVLIA